MGIGASKGQGSEATYEKRDVETVSADKSNWPELAGAKLAKSNGSGRKPHSISMEDFGVLWEWEFCGNSHRIFCGNGMGMGIEI